MSAGRLQLVFDQAEFDIRCEWGEQGVARLAPISDVVIIVDVMSFSTCVEIAVSRGAIVYPCRWKDGTAGDLADSVGGVLAGKRGRSGYSLSPASLLELPAKTSLVLPSPNGSNLTMATGSTPTLAGCLRNARAVAGAAMRYGPRVAVIPAGERWKDDHSLRPALEDLVGAGAIIEHLPGRLSPEAQAARAVYRSVGGGLDSTLKQCASGKELAAKESADDLELIAESNVSECVPVFLEGAYRPGNAIDKI
jgi:2-phosphosulfolactate phosphatase